jgi:glutaredoxin 3
VPGLDKQALATYLALIVSFGGRALAKVEIYSTMWCPFCHHAKRLLSNKGVEFTEIDVGMSGTKKKEMLVRAEGRRTVPQIFIDDVGIGGCDELYALESDGKLDPMLT